MKSVNLNFSSAILRSYLLSLASWTLGFIFFVVWIWRHGSHLFERTFFEDEAYYIGAARALYHGDWFLTNYAFDKPFLQAYIPWLGVLLAGEQALGYRLAGFLFWVIGFCIWFRNFKYLFGTERLRDLVLAFLFASAFYLNPAFSNYSTSPMAESFLFFIFGLICWSVSIKKDFTKSSRFWALAFACKQTIVFWIFQIFDRIPHSFSELISVGLAAWQKTKWIFALVLLFMLTGPHKLSPVTMALAGLGQATEKSTWSQIFLFWWQMILQTGAGFSILVIAVVAIWLGLLRQSDAESRRQHIQVLIFAAILHLVLLLVLRVNLYPRYYLPVLAQLFWVAILCLNHARIKTWVRYVIAIIFLICAFLQEPSVMNPVLQRGTELQRLKFEVPDTAIIHIQNPWQRRPFETLTGQDYTGCISPECIARVRIARPLMKDQWVVRMKHDGDQVHIERQPFLVDPSNASNWQTETVLEKVPLQTQAKLVDNLLDQMRLVGVVDVESVSLLDEGLLSFSGRLKKPLLGLKNFQLQFAITIKPEPADERGDRVVRVGLRLVKALIENKDLTSMIVCLRGGPLLTLGENVFFETAYDRIEKVEIQADADSRLLLNITRTKVQKKIAKLLSR